MAAPMSLSGQPSVADMEKVIREFYQGPQAGNPQLQQYLRAFQLSQASWSMVWEFLDPNKTTEVQFFAATTLHVKISHFWHEVSGAEREQMLKRLLELSKTYLNLPHGGVMFNRLSMSMGNLCLHLLAEGDDSSVDRVFAEASNLGEKALLELLIVLPDEANAPCFVTFKKQAVLKNGLLRYGPRVLSLLSNTLSGSSVPSISPLRCLVSWVRLGLALEQTEPLWPALFSAVKNPNLAQSALEACQSLLTQPGNEQFPNLLERLISNMVTSLEPILKAAMDGGDVEFCQGIYEVLLEIAESHSSLVIRWLGGQDQRLKGLAVEILNIILSCSGFPGKFPVDESLSDMAFGVWYIIQDEMVNAEEQEHKELDKWLVPMYYKLVTILLGKAAYPADLEEWSSEDREAFRCYRQDIADCLMYCYYILRGGVLLDLLDGQLKQCLEQSVSWQQLETVLHGYGSVSEGLSDDQDKDEQTGSNLVKRIPGFIQTLGTLRQKADHPTVQNTLLTTLGAYSSWYHHAREYLPDVIDTTLGGLSNPALSQSASLALKDIVKENQALLAPLATRILEKCQEAISSGKLGRAEAVRLMYPIGRCLVLLPPHQILPSLETVLSPFVQQWQNLLYKTDLQQIKQDSSEVVTHLRVFEAICNSLTLPDNAPLPTGFSSPPLLPFLQHILPSLKHLLGIVNDYEVTDAACRMLKQALSSLKDHTAPLAAEMITLCVHMVRACPHPAVLDVARQIVILYGGNSSHAGALSSFVSEVTAQLLNLLEQKGERELTDTLESFLQLLKDTLRKHPQLITENSSLNVMALYQCGCVALGLPEVPSVRAASIFLSLMIKMSSTNPMFRQIVVSQGPNLNQALIRYIARDSPRFVFDPLSDVLLHLSREFPAEEPIWLQEALNQLSLPPNLNKEKEAFLKGVMKEKSNKRQLNGIVSEFALTCRGIIGTEYAAQTSRPIVG